MATPCKRCRVDWLTDQISMRLAALWPSCGTLDHWFGRCRSRSRAHARGQPCAMCVVPAAETLSWQNWQCCNLTARKPSAARLLNVHSADTPCVHGLGFQVELHRYTCALHVGCVLHFFGSRSWKLRRSDLVGFVKFLCGETLQLSNMVSPQGSAHQGI